VKEPVAAGDGNSEQKAQQELGFICLRGLGPYSR
jgi:hypothetical protein